MKRRAFLAMLGLVPVAAVAAAKQSPEIDWAAIEGRTINEIQTSGTYRVPPAAEPKVTLVNPWQVTESWKHPDFDALDTPGRNTLTMVKVPASRDHCGTEMQLLNEDGVVLIRQWSRK